MSSDSLVCSYVCYNYIDVGVCVQEAELHTWTAFLQRTVEANYNTEVVMDNLYNLVGEPFLPPPPHTLAYSTSHIGSPKRHHAAQFSSANRHARFSWTYCRKQVSSRCFPSPPTKWPRAGQHHTTFKIRGSCVPNSPGYMPDIHILRNEIYYRTFLQNKRLLCRNFALLN